MTDRRDRGPPKKRARFQSREQWEAPESEDEDVESSPSPAPSKPAPVEPPQQEHPYNTRGGQQGPSFPSSSSNETAFRGGDVVAQVVLEQKDRRRHLANVRADKKRKQIALIQNKPEQERTEEEQEFLEKQMDQRLRKNQRTKELANEKRAEAERILMIPEDDRTEQEEKTLELYMTKLAHKNEGDRLRRKQKKNRELDNRTSIAARQMVTAAGSAYWETRGGDYRYPPPYPYPLVQPHQPPPPFPPANSLGKSALVPVAAHPNPSKGDALPNEPFHSPFHPSFDPLQATQKQLDRYTNNGAHCPPHLQHQLLARATAFSQLHDGGHSSTHDIKQNSDSKSPSDDGKGGGYTEDLKHPRRGRRRLPAMSNTEIEQREKVRRSLKNERNREKKERAKDRMAMILKKAEYERTKEELEFVELQERSRALKNARGRQRNQAKREKMDGILAKPKGERAQEETDWLASELKKKKAKNAKDCMRRSRIKEDKIKNQSKIDIMLESVLGLAELDEYPQEFLEDSD